MFILLDAFSTSQKSSFNKKNKSMGDFATYKDFMMTLFLKEYIIEMIS